MIQLPDFTRIMWTSQKAREVWQPRIEAINRAWMEIEIWAVSKGVRQVALQVAMPEELPVRARYVMDLGLVLVPLTRQGAGCFYATTTPGIKPGGAWEYRVAICKPEVASQFTEAFWENDNRTIGQLLGYPTCCIDFFQHIWVEEKRVDTTWQMAVNAQGSGGNMIEVWGPPEANILLRWLGVRAVPHLPCSFTCQATVNLGKRLIEIGRAQGYDREMDWLLEMLSWPIEWSALHGIAAIKTPVLQISARTDYTPSKLMVRYQGSGYPEEGAQGLVFPFRLPKGTHFTETEFHQKDRVNEWYWKDNGFSTFEAQEQAHRPILDLILQIAQGGNIVDLGCGNGALLRELRERNQTFVPYGVDINPVAIQHAWQLLPEFATHFQVDNMFSYQLPIPTDIVLLMPGRLLEAGKDKVSALLRALYDSKAVIVVYTYGDWLKRFGSLDALCRRVGLTIMPDTIQANAITQTAIIQS